MKDLFKKPTAWLILAFIVGLTVMFAKEAKADTAMLLSPETQFIAGKHTQGTALSITESFVDDKFEVGIMLNVNTEDDNNNAALFAQRIVRYKKFGMGIGVAAWKNETRAWNSSTTFALGLRWEFNDHWILQHMHFSTGGSSRRNGGLDMLQIGYRF